MFQTFDPRFRAMTAPFQADFSLRDGEYLRRYLYSCIYVAGQQEYVLKQNVSERSSGLIESILYSFEGITMQSAKLKQEASDIRQAQLYFSGTLILLGLLTTVVSALNSTQFGSGTNLSASVIKITAIILPALVTAVTAYGALVAAPDSASRKSQLVYNLIRLRTELVSYAHTLPCPLTQDKVEVQVAGYSNWSKRYGDIIASAEIDQPAVQGEGQGKGDQNKPAANNSENPLATASGGNARSNARDP